MKTIKILSLLITIFFSLAANSFAAQISGTVYDGAGNPVTGGGRVEVFYDNSGMYPPSNEAYLNLDGTYIIQGLNAGSYYLRASSNGNHVTEWWADPASTPTLTQAQAVTVAEGEIVTGIDFQLDAGAQISGTVLDSSGNPVSDVYIAASTGDPCGMYTTVSSGGVDIDGNYTIQRLPAGSYYLQASSYLFSPEWWAGSENSPDCSQAQAVTVASSETIAGMDFQLSTRAQISGTVYDDAGNPITGGGKVEVFSDNSGMYPPFNEAYLNLDGTYIIQGLNAGSYYLLASSNGNHVTEWWADPASTPISTQAQAVTVAEGEIVTGIDFQLDAGPVDLDTDGDGIIDNEDNCPLAPNSGQLDYDSDTIGDLCDNCPYIYNPGQEDNDANGVGDACEMSDDDGPDVFNVHVAPNPVAINSSSTLSATIDDTGRGDSDIQSAEYNFNNDGWIEMYPVDILDSPTDDVEYEFVAPVTPGVYDLCVRGTDILGNTGEPECTLLVVYDPNGGFVTGGGWINSPAGAYFLDPYLTGKAHFGFVSKYQKKLTVPSGNTEFVFEAGNLYFHSDTYEWLLVTGNKYARFKGIGTINGAGSYNFMIWAGDGSPDTFRIKIWEEDKVTAVETVIYDNGKRQLIPVCNQNDLNI